MRGVIAGIALLAQAAAGTASADQRHLENALDALQQARQQLEAATRTEGGYRERALQHVVQAMDQVKRGIQEGEDDTQR